MKSRIQELKIRNYKKKIFLEYSYLNVIEVFHGVEDVLNTNFSKKAINSNDIIVKEFSIHNTYIDENKIYQEAFKYFRDSLKIFNEDEDIIFNVIYNNERFRIVCPFSQFNVNFDKIKHLEETVMIYDKNLTKITSIFRMEYCFEVSVLKT